MRFTMQVDMNNAAFEGNPGEELQRILSNLHLQHKVDPEDTRYGSNIGKVSDINGNTVGLWEVTA